MTFTLELFRHVLFKLIPDVIMHTQNQDEEQIRDNYDRMSFAQSRLPRVQFLNAITCFLNPLLIPSFLL